MSERINPFWAAWLRAHPGRVLPTYEFLIWMSRMWQAFEAERGLPPHRPRSPHLPEFAPWLEARVSNALEAA